MSQPHPFDQNTAQIIHAPSRPPHAFKTSIFLAGTTASSTNWRQTLTTALARMRLTILNPLRPDWDNTWREEASCDQFREQVEWELDMQEQADLVIVYFGPETDAPISLLELGLCARTGMAIVVCHAEYKRRGNVEILCRKFGLPFLDADENWVGGVVSRVMALLAARVEDEWD